MSTATPLGVREFLQIVDIRTKIVSLSSLAIGTAYAAHLAHSFDPWLFALMLVATLAVDMGTTGFNSYYDFVQGVDTPDTDVERSKVLVQRGLDPALAQRVSWSLFVVAAIVGLALGALVDWRLVLAGGACMLVALLYSGGPVPIARLPVGEIFAGGLLGLVLIVIAAFVQTRSVDARVIWLGLPSSTLIATILSVNNLCDAEGDARAGRRTLAIVLGQVRAERTIWLQMAVTLALVVALVPLGVLPASALLPIAAAAFVGWRELAAMHRRGYSHATKAAAMGGISKVFVVYTLAILIGIAFGVVGLP